MESTNRSDLKILDLVAKDTRFTKFNQAIKVAGMADKLTNAEHLTLLAPTNEAFARAPQDKLGELMRPENREQLKKLLQLHVIPQAIKADEFKTAASVKTESGNELKITVSDDRKNISVNNARVLLPKQEAKNGYLYPVDELIQPLASGASAGAPVKA